MAITNEYVKGHVIQLHSKTMYWLYGPKPKRKWLGQFKSRKAALAAIKRT